MREATPSEAAAILGRSDDTVRRRTQLPPDHPEHLPSRREGTRLIIQLPDDPAEQMHSSRAAEEAQALRSELAGLHEQLRGKDELLSEVRRSRDDLARQLDAMGERYDALFSAYQDSQESADRSRLQIIRVLSERLVQLVRPAIHPALPAPRDDDGQETDPQHAEQSAGQSKGAAQQEAGGVWSWIRRRRLR